jgi:hypothetical protein
MVPWSKLIALRMEERLHADPEFLIVKKEKTGIFAGN